MQDPKCDAESKHGYLHLHDNKCRPCQYYSECKYIAELKKYQTQRLIETLNDREIREDYWLSGGLTEEEAARIVSEAKQKRELIRRTDVLALAEKGILVSNGNYESVCKAINSIPAANQWIPIKTRPMTPEELEEYGERFDTDEIYECELPDHGQEVLVTTKWGVNKTTFYDDGLEGCYFDDYEGDGEVIAWMPLPEEYKEVDE